MKTSRMDKTPFINLEKKEGVYIKGWARVWVSRHGLDKWAVSLAYGPHKKNVKYGPDYVGTAFVPAESWPTFQVLTIAEFKKLADVQDAYISSPNLAPILKAWGRI